jgi:hypothetical protein
MNNIGDGSISMSVESSLNLTLTLSLVRRGRINFISPDSLGGLRGINYSTLDFPNILDSDF